MLYELTLPAPSVPIHQTATTNCISPIQQKDYSRPLHVDCSVEYELPSQVKPPPPTNGKIDPLLMIHPCYFRKIEAQRRSPFINNLPGRGVATTNQPTNVNNIASNRCTTANRIISGQTNTNSTNTQHAATAVVCHNRPNNNIVKNPQPQPQPYPHYQMPNTVRHQQHGWPTDPQHAPKPSTLSAAAVGTANKHPTHHHHHPHHQQHQHQLPSLASCAATNALYNSTAASAIGDGGLWTNTNHSPLAAERFPEPTQATLHQIQPTITTATATANSNGSANNSCSKNHVLATGKYRQYLRTHRLHPYMSMATSAFPQFTQMQQISCYNV